MSLDMFGQIDDVFTSTIGTRTPSGGSYIDGKWVPAAGAPSPHNVNVQPLNMKQIKALEIGAERVEDYRNVWVNDGLIAEISPSDKWTFSGVDGTFKVTQLDNRANYPTGYSRNYCKFVAVREDL